MRTELVLAGILLAGPDQFHRPLHGFGDGDGLRDLIIRVAAAETAADEGVVDINLLRLQAGEAALPHGALLPQYCVPTHTSSRSGCKCTVAFIGSIGECER